MKLSEKVKIVRKRLYRRVYQQKKNKKNIFRDSLNGINLEELLGVSLNEYVYYLEDNFHHGMCFSRLNFDIDHIDSLYRSMSVEEYLSRWNYKNTLPVDPDINRQKSDKYFHELIIRKKIDAYVKKNGLINSKKAALLYKRFSHFFAKDIEEKIKTFYTIKHKKDLINFTVKKNIITQKYHESRKSLLLYHFIGRVGINSFEFLSNNLRVYLFFIDNPDKYIKHRDTLIENINSKKFFDSLVNDHLVDDIGISIEMLTYLKSLLNKNIISVEIYKKYRSLIIDFEKLPIEGYRLHF